MITFVLRKQEHQCAERANLILSIQGFRKCVHKTLQVMMMLMLNLKFGFVVGGQLDTPT